MNLHEFQAKEILKKHNINIPNNCVIKSSEELNQSVINKLVTKDKFVVKAQIHAGGRGKAGGVKLFNTDNQGINEATAFTRSLFNKNLVTYQTDDKGQLVNYFLIESSVNIQQELYLGMLVDRAKSEIICLVSTEGGVEIEKTAIDNPSKIKKVHFKISEGYQPYQGRILASQIGLKGKLFNNFVKLYFQLANIFIKYDLSQLEINPLIIDKNEELYCLDCKMSIDESAVYRQKDIADIYDYSQEDKREVEAKKNNINFIALEGNIGCLVNGAGLAMATMDTIKLYGGSPANFLDVGGSSNAERACKAFSLITMDKNIKGILVNIFGGIVRCNLIAEALIEGIKQTNCNLPIVVRLQGNNAEQANQLISESKHINIYPESDLDKATQKIIELTK